MQPILQSEHVMQRIPILFVQYQNPEFCRKFRSSVNPFSTEDYCSKFQEEWEIDKRFLAFLFNWLYAWAPQGGGRKVYLHAEWALRYLLCKIVEVTSH